MSLSRTHIYADAQLSDGGLGPVIKSSAKFVSEGSLTFRKNPSERPDLIKLRDVGEVANKRKSTRELERERETGGSGLADCCVHMSGKKKNRNKIKRTGTASQGGSAPVVDKTEVLVANEGIELSNGNGEHPSTEAAEQVEAGDSSVVEVSQSSAEGVTPGDLNGESSGTN